MDEGQIGGHQMIVQMPGSAAFTRLRTIVVNIIVTQDDIHIVSVLVLDE